MLNKFSKITTWVPGAFLCHIKNVATQPNTSSSEVETTSFEIPSAYHLKQYLSQKFPNGWMISPSGAQTILTIPLLDDVMFKL